MFSSLGIDLVEHLYCTGIALIPCSYYIGTGMIYWYWAGAVPVLHWAGTRLVLHWFYIGIALVPHSYRTGTSMVLHRCSTSVALVLCFYYGRTGPVLHGHCAVLSCECACAVRVLRF